MKTTRLIILCSLIILIGFPVRHVHSSEKKPKYVAVKLSDRAKEVSYCVMTETEYEEEAQKIKMEAKHWRMALRLAEKEWANQSEEERKTFKRFPKFAVSVQKISTIGRSNYDRETIQDKVYRIQEKAEDKEDEFEDREEDKVDKVRYELTRHVDDPILKRRIKKRYSAYDDRKEEYKSARESELQKVRAFFDQILSGVIKDAVIK